jgi:hypothetical protein
LNKITPANNVLIALKRPLHSPLATIKTLKEVMKTEYFALFFISVFLCCCKQINKNELEKLKKSTSLEKVWSITSITHWVKNEGLLNIESIVYDEVNRVFYATNGVDYEVGTNGFISKISEDGRLQELKWVDHLNRPTGMAIYNSLLYVADVNALVVIDIKSGKIIDKFIEPISNSGLNDVSISSNGSVYVSASFIHSIFKLNNGKLDQWLIDEEKLKFANGLIADDKQLLVGGINLSRIDVESKRINKIELDSSVEDFDGMVSDGAGGYFLTTVKSSGLFQLTRQKKITKLMNEDVYFGDLEFIPNRKKIFIPRGDKKTNDFFVTVLTVE